MLQSKIFPTNRLALLTHLEKGNSYEMINECRSGLSNSQ